MNKQFFDDVAKKISDAVPSGVKHAREDFEKQVKTILQNAFSKLDLVTREEFDAQVKVLARTRSKLNQLEKEVDQLTKQHHKAHSEEDESHQSKGEQNAE